MAKKFTLTFEMEDGQNAGSWLVDKCNEMLGTLRNAHADNTPFFTIADQDFFVTDLVEEGDEVKATLQYLD